VERSDDGGTLIEDPDFRRKIAELEIAVESLNATELRIFAGRGAGKAVGAASSMLKLAGSGAQQAITELALEAVGTYAAPFVRGHLGHEGQRTAARDRTTPAPSPRPISTTARPRSMRARTRSSTTSSPRWCWGSEVRASFEARLTARTSG
jgi:alkylation response protein AidB-like acyl-CoA dehydrogenase